MPLDFTETLLVFAPLFKVSLWWKSSV